MTEPDTPPPSSQPPPAPHSPLPLPAWAAKRKPTPRPRWLGILAVAMLVSGGRLLLNGFSILDGLDTPGSPARAPDAIREPGAEPPAGATRDELRRDLTAFAAALDREHPWAVRANAGAEIAVALLLLFAVAAIFSNDPRGRKATLTAAWAGIAYHVGNAAFLLLVVRAGLLSVAPRLANVVAARGGSGTSQDILSLLESFTLIATGVTTLVGISFNVVLLVFFGRRRGRLYYGVERLPQHGS